MLPDEMKEHGLTKLFGERKKQLGLDHARPEPRERRELGPAQRPDQKRFKGNRGFESGRR